MNTLDFMLVPNTNLSERFGNKVLDLYLATRDVEVEGNYVRLFYGFTIVDEEEFSRIEEMFQSNKDMIYERKIENLEDTGDKGHFEGAVVAECKFEETNNDEK